MAFDLTTWKGRVRERLTGWRQRMQQAGITSVYNFLCVATLWPVVQAAQGGDWGATGALGAALARVGSNLIANRLQGRYRYAALRRQSGCDRLVQ